MYYVFTIKNYIRIKLGQYLTFNVRVATKYLTLFIQMFKLSKYRKQVNEEDEEEERRNANVLHTFNSHKALS